MMISPCVIHFLVLLFLPCSGENGIIRSDEFRDVSLLQVEAQKSAEIGNGGKQGQVRLVQVQKSQDPQTLVIMLYINLACLSLVALIVMRLICANRSSDETVQPSEDSSISQALPSVLTWAAIGIALIMFNKYMYMKVEEGGFGFPCPMSLTWCHMFVGMLMTQALSKLKPEWMPAVTEGKVDQATFFKSIVPVGVVFAAYLSIGNCAYLYLSVSYIQMLKSAGPIAVHLLACLAGVERMEISTVCTVVIICFGVGGASVGEGNFSLFGFLLQLVAFVLDGLRMVLLKTLIASNRVNLDPLSGLYYYSPVCVVALLAPAAYFEGAKLSEAFQTLPEHFIFILLANALLAFSLNCILLSLFRVASPTTVSVASVARDIILTFGSAWWFHTSLSPVQIAGYLSACLGVKLWDQIKSQPQSFEKAILKPLFESKDKLLKSASTSPAQGPGEKDPLVSKP